MRYSRHASIRSQQRGIPTSVIELIVEYGTAKPQSDGTCVFELRPRDKKAAVQQFRQSLQHLESASGKKVVVGGENTVVTVFHSHD